MGDNFVILVSSPCPLPKNGEMHFHYQNISIINLYIICEQALPGSAREIIQVVRKLSIRDKTFTGICLSPRLICVLSYQLLDRKLRNFYLRCYFFRLESLIRGNLICFLL